MDYYFNCMNSSKGLHDKCAKAKCAKLVCACANNFEILVLTNVLKTNVPNSTTHTSCHLSQLGKMNHVAHFSPNQSIITKQSKIHSAILSKNILKSGSSRLPTKKLFGLCRVWQRVTSHNLNCTGL